jgi:hypothetical protein
MYTTLTLHSHYTHTRHVHYMQYTICPTSESAQVECSRIMTCGRHPAPATARGLPAQEAQEGVLS